ncbi:hypothetical protein ABZT08_06135 [Streptomyces sp. NPDC005526]|uniref:hypothetical protein n=1 Tax=Streptomyces sp. NPDC005526 TaxID=3156885 RepID=UPI0033BA5582
MDGTHHRARALPKAAGRALAGLDAPLAATADTPASVAAHDTFPRHLPAHRDVAHRDLAHRLRGTAS